MKLAALGFACLVMSGVSALAQDVGIQFAKMKVGTTLLTQALNDATRIKSQKFIGKQGNFFVVEESYINTDGSTKALGKTYYDLKGRESKADWFDGPAYYTPYSCFYAVGSCKQSLDYPNPYSKKKNKRTVSVRRYNNRLEGKKLVVSWKLASGKIHEVPFTLGMYNFRISRRYQNALGELRGHKLIKIVEPGSTKKTVQPKLAKEAEAVADAVDCSAVYARLKKNAPGDASICKVKFGKPKFRTCKLPEKFSTERPASRIVLILDASGSMAGKIRGKTKMQVAKKEALSFLNALQADVSVGLIIYGHRGDNTESGKEASCKAIEWAHKIGASKAALTKSVNDLKPTGWTPLSRALAFAGDELARLPPHKDDKVSVPVVYMLSDGKETCGGDAVAQAKTLQASGLPVTINVIGFDVDDEVRTELEAISKAGGGKYFPAKDAAALRKQLRAIQETEAAKQRYNNCQNFNLGQVHSVYHNAGIKLAGCFGREGNRNGIYAMLKQIKAIEKADGLEKTCVQDLKRRAYAEHAEMNRIIGKQHKILKSAREKALADFRANSRFKPLEN